jgi:hypothetical protein
MEKSMVKVLAVPEQYSSRSVPQSVVYAADFEDDEENIVRLVSEICGLWGCSLKILHVRGQGEDPSLGKSRFEGLNIGNTSGNIEFIEIENHDVVDAIQNYAQSAGCDILAMAMHRRNILERLFHRSKTKEIAHHTHIPVLALHKKN